MNSFFVWRRSNGLNANPNLRELDLQLGDYLNHLYLRDMPLYLGTNCIAGFKKFHPRCKPQLNTASSWLNNWTRSIRRTQAMPLHPDLVKAFVAFGILKQDPDFAISLYVGFLALLRGSEIFNLCLCDCQPRGPHQICLTLRSTKGAQLRNVEFETVTISDPFVIRILLSLKEKGKVRLFNGNSSDFYKRYREAVSFFDLSHPKPTPHGIRRGGASWHFRLYGSFDRTVEHGRWATVSSARTYINEAAAEKAVISRTDAGQIRLKEATSLCMGLLSREYDIK